MEDQIDKSTPKTETESSQSNTENEAKLFKVEVAWRVVKIKGGKIVRRGNLGMWSSEFKLVVADSKERAKQIIKKHYSDMGFETSPNVTPMNSRNEVEIRNIRRLA